MLLKGLWEFRKVQILGDIDVASGGSLKLAGTALASTGGEMTNGDGVVKVKVAYRVHATGL